MAVGRPPIYNDEMPARLIKHVTEDGGTSLSSFAASIGTGRAIINHWINEKPEFAQAVQVAKAHLATWWEAQARKVGENGGGNGQSSMVAFALKNFASQDWTEKQEIQHSGQVEHKLDVSRLSDEELAILEKALK